MNIEALPIIRPHEKEQDTGAVISIAGGHLVNDTYAAFASPLLPLLIQKFSLSLTAAGSLAAIGQLPAIFNPFFGYLIERYHLWYLVILAPAFTATSASLLGLAPSPWVLALLLFVSGISTALYHAPTPALIGALTPKKLGRSMSWYMAAGELGYTLGPILIVWAVSIWTLEGSYRILVIGWLVSLILFLRLRRFQFPRGNASTANYGAELRTIMPALRRFFIPMAGLLFMRNFLTVLLVAFLPTFMNTRGANLWLSGASLSIIELSGAAGVLIIGPLSDHWGRKPSLIITMVAGFLSLLIFLNVQSWLLIPSLLLVGFSSLSSGPILLAIVQEHFPAHRAVSNGIYMGLAFLLQSFSTVIIGTMGDRLGLWQTFYWCGVLSLLSIPFVFTFPNQAKP